MPLKTVDIYIVKLTWGRIYKAVNKEYIHSLTAANCENFANYMSYGVSFSHQVEEVKGVILDTPPANLTPTSKFVTEMIGEIFTSSDVFETDSTSTTDGDLEEEIESGGEHTTYRSLRSKLLNIVDH